MTALLFAASIVLLLAGHIFRLLRWEQFIRIYERPSHGFLLTGMAGGYALNFLLPFHLGDIFRAVFAGRKMKSGTGFGFATVIMDRFLDIWFVALFFCLFRLSGAAGAEGPAMEFIILSVSVLLAAAVVAVFSNSLKKLCLRVGGIFNDSIRLDFLTFFWSIINTFKDLRHVKPIRLLANTLAMWGAYMASYYVMARCLSLNGLDRSLYDIFSLLFANQGIAKTTMSVAAATASGKMRVLLISWLLVPVLVMLAVTLLPRRTKDAISSVTGIDDDTEYANLLPQLDRNDRADFLTRYFGLENKDYLEKFLAVNRNISILQDYSAGSNATTMLCMDSHGDTFFRKYAFGTDGKKLAEQLEWLKTHETEVPLCSVIRSGTDDACCWYDMEYDPSATDFFRFIHSNPVEKSCGILLSILDRFREDLYAAYETEKAGKGSDIDRYIDSKVTSNLTKLRESRVLRDLLQYDTLVINGTEYKNLPLLEKMLEPEHLRAIFSEDPVSCVHGDMTVENIICRTGEMNSWYVIDPNAGNVHDTPYLDYAKLMQSLHGSYEFMMMTQRCSVIGNRIDFPLTRSAAYDELLAALKKYILSAYGEKGMESISMHEVVHWLRLMPYKLAHDRKRAPMFYAGMIMVMNDVYGEM